MSKLKINDKVIVKENGKVGVVKGREIKQLTDGKVKIEYVVKTGEGFNHWKAYRKNELERVNPIKTEKKLPTLVVDADNGYKITLVGIVRNQTVWKDVVDDIGFFNTYARKGKNLSIGYSIYNPNDKYDPDFGKRIAIHRAKKKPFCHMVSDFNGEFNHQTIMALLEVKGKYIANNLEHFISK